MPLGTSSQEPQITERSSTIVPERLLISSKRTRDFTFYSLAEPLSERLSVNHYYTAIFLHHFLFFPAGMIAARQSSGAPLPAVPFATAAASGDPLASDLQMPPPFLLPPHETFAPPRAALPETSLLAHAPRCR